MQGALLSFVREAEVMHREQSGRDPPPDKVSNLRWGVQQECAAVAENPDILAAVAQSARALSRALYCVGFAAESQDLLANAQAKRVRKGVPLLVGNIGPATFGQDDNALLLVDEAGAQELPRNSKLVLARQLIANIASRIRAGGRNDAG